MQLRISQAIWNQLTADLFQRKDVETAGLLFGEAVTTNGNVIVVRQAMALPEWAYNIRKIDQISIDPVALNKLIRPARDNGWSVVTIHTHPGAAEPWFSTADDAGDSRLMPSLRCQIPGAVHGSIVVVDTGDVVARVFDERGSSRDLELHTVGKTLRSMYNGEHRDEPWFSRQQLALGKQGQSLLRRLRVAVIGLGGIGSLVSMQLAHLGVGELVLIDGDLVEASNLSRVVGGLPSDAGQSFKVDVAARYALSLGFSRVEVHREFLGAAHEPYLASCDVIISCVDMHTPRAILNRLSYRCLVPVIDLGTVFRVGPDGGITGEAGRVVVIGPERPCLSCWGHIDAHALRIEALSAEQREGEERLGYIQGAFEPQPSVIAFNTAVAGAGIVELMRLVTAFAGAENPPNRMAFSFTEGTVRRNTLSRNSECRICGGSHALAPAASTQKEPREEREHSEFE